MCRCKPRGRSQRVDHWWPCPSLTILLIRVATHSNETVRVHYKAVDSGGVCAVMRGAKHQIADAVCRKMPRYVNNRGYKQRRRALMVCRRSPERGQPSPTLAQAGAWIVLTVAFISYRSRRVPRFASAPSRRVRCCRCCVLFRVRVVCGCRHCVWFRVCAVSPRPNFAEARRERWRRGDSG